MLSRGMSSKKLFGIGRTRAVVAIGAAALLGATTITAVRVLLLQGPTDGRQGYSGAFDPTMMDPDDVNQPLLIGGRLVTLEEANRQLAMPIYRPHDTMASDESLIQVWLASEIPEVAIRYESGLRIYVTLWPPGRNPSEFYAQQVAQTGFGSFAEIDGHPAWVIPEDAQAEGHPPATVVDMTIGRVQVSLWAHLSVSRLMEIAESVR